MTEYVIGKFNNKRWAVLHTPTRVWYFPEEYGKKRAQQLCDKLNKQKPSEQPLPQGLLIADRIADMT